MRIIVVGTIVADTIEHEGGGVTESLGGIAHTLAALVAAGSFSAIANYLFDHELADRRDRSGIVYGMVEQQGHPDDVKNEKGEKHGFEQGY